MLIERLTVPYEILIRFGFAADHQKVKPGEFSGAHFVTADLIIDDSTNQLIAPPIIGQAVDVPQEMLTSLLGKEFAAVNAGFDSMKQQLYEASVANEQLNITIQELKEQNEKLAKQLASLNPAASGT